MLRSLRSAFLVVACALAISPVASATAAPSAWESVAVTLHSEQSGGGTFLVSGELPASVRLPATAELSVPAGSELQWIGEILGGAASADPALEYTKATRAGSDSYRFKLSKSRVAQIETPVKAPVPFDGTAYSPSIAWSATEAVPKVTLRVRVPQGAQITQEIAGATLVPGEPGYADYTKTYTNVKPGDKLELAFAYTAAVAPASTPAADSSSSGSIFAGIVVALAILGALGFAIFARKRSSDESTEVDEPSGVDESSEIEESSEVNGLSGSAKRSILTATVIGAMVIAVVVFAGQSTKPKLAGDTVSRTFSQGEACASGTIQVVQKNGGDPAATAETLFDALEGLDGVNTATFNAKTSSLDIGWCDSKTSEAAVRQALAPTGLVSETAAAPLAASPASSAAKATSDTQILSVDTSTGSFAPTQLSAKAGAPVQITFGQGSGCISDVVFPELQIKKNLEGGPVTIDLPALEPGRYAFACGMDMQRGTLVIE